MTGITLPASQIILDNGVSLEEILQDIGSSDFQEKVEQGTPYGYTTLDVNGKILLSQLPSYGLTVVAIDALIDLPFTGEQDVIYRVIDTNENYSWNVQTNSYDLIGSFVDLSKETSKLSEERIIGININGTNRGSVAFDGSSDVAIDLDYQLNVITTDRILIANNTVVFNIKSIEDIKQAYIYRDTTNVASVYECAMTVDGLSVTFDPTDNLNGLDCTLRYFSVV